jgi:hypothetical protein
MGKISRVIALIIASMAVALAGCNAGERGVAKAGEAALGELGGVPKGGVPKVEPPKIDVPKPALIDPVPPPGSEKFAEQHLPALRAATHWNKQEELKFACGVYNVPQFMKASDKTRWLEAKFKIPSAQAAELGELAEEIEQLPEHPTALNVITATADAICQGQETVEGFGE